MMAVTRKKWQPTKLDKRIAAAMKAPTTAMKSARLSYRKSRTLYVIRYIQFFLSFLQFTSLSYPW